MLAEAIQVIEGNNMTKVVLQDMFVQFIFYFQQTKANHKTLCQSILEAWTTNLPVPEHLKSIQWIESCALAGDNQLNVNVEIKIFTPKKSLESEEKNLWEIREESKRAGEEVNARKLR